MSPQEGPKRKIRVVASGRFAQSYERATGTKWSGEVDRSIDDSIPPFFNELTPVQKEKFQPLVGQVPTRVSVAGGDRGIYSVSFDLGEYNFWLPVATVEGLDLLQTQRNQYVQIPFVFPFQAVTDLGHPSGLGMRMTFGEGESISFATGVWGMAKRRNPQVQG